MSSFNYGGSARGTNGQLEYDFYGMLSDIVQLGYTSLPSVMLVLFNCDCVDNTPNTRTKVDNKYRIVEVNQGDMIKHMIHSYLHKKRSNFIA